MMRAVALCRPVRWLCCALAFLGGCLVLIPRDARAAQGVHHDLAVRLDPASRELVVEDAITVGSGGAIEFTLARRFTVEQCWWTARRCW
jgi:hypothetical protein